jgi:U3 small nucleolar RNA-associated protein 4
MALNGTEDKLAVACEDGFVRIFNIAEGELEYVRAFGGSEGRLLSVAWHPSEDVLFAGSASGSIRGWDIAASPQHFIRISVDSPTKTPALVWSLLVLTCVSCLFAAFVCCRVSQQGVGFRP